MRRGFRRFFLGGGRRCATCGIDPTRRCRLLAIEGDSSQVQQVVMNLVTNEAVLGSGTGRAIDGRTPAVHQTERTRRRVKASPAFRRRARRARDIGRLGQNGRQRPRLAFRPVHYRSRSWPGSGIDCSAPPSGHGDFRSPEEPDKYSPSLSVYCGERGLQFTNQITLAALSRFRGQWKDGTISGGKKLERLRAFGRFLVDRRMVGRESRP